MKTILIFTSVLLSMTQFTQAASIECTETGSVTSVHNGGDFDSFWENCQSSLYEGDVCFRGKRSDVLELLGQLDEADILGDEYRIIDTWYVGKYAVKYSVYDGPNELVAMKNVISRCD